MAETGWTALRLCNTALRKLGVLPSGSAMTYDSNLASDTYETLSHLIDGWQVELGLTFAYDTLTYTVTGATQPVTGFPLGTTAAGGTITLDSGISDADSASTNSKAWGHRPSRVLAVRHVDSSGTSHIVPEVGAPALRDVFSTTLITDPVQMWSYNAGYLAGSTNAPVGYLLLWPTPATGTLYVDVPWVLDTVAADGATSFSDSTLCVPPAYAEALVYNLALRMAPEFEKPVPPVVAQLAADALARLRRMNLRAQAVPALRMPASLPGVQRTVADSHWIERGA